MGRRESTAGGGDGGGIVDVKGLALVATVCTTTLHMRDVRGIQDGYAPVVRKLPGACEADLLEHGNKGRKDKRREQVVVEDEERGDVERREGGTGTGA